eukprot:8413747-Pyramimonas_sp.AAC.2
MIFDPGAAEELAGTQTLLEYAREVVWPNGLDVRSIPPKGNASFSGIDGIPMRSQMTARVPVDLGPVITDIETATIGGSGEMPVSLLQQDIDQAEDSGHYLIPIDHGFQNKQQTTQTFIEQAAAGLVAP